MSKELTFHLLPNAHLDPVWLWDWREGLNEGITTVTTILDLMDEYPELTFLRGEASIYRHIQKTAPDVFERILQRIAEGRWDVVGGTDVQPDSHLCSTETLCRHFEASLRYFEREVGVRPTIAWQADSFGHSAGWPNILRSFGMDGFAFSRPQRTEFPMESPVFWWQCDYADRLLCYRQHWKWYCSERFNLLEKLDFTLQGALRQPFHNVGVLMGMGNHGGGPTRRHIAEVAQWRKQHPGVEVRFSTLHGYFQALREELEAGAPVDTLSGEFGFCQRGCFSSVQKFKAPYRQAEAKAAAAEAADALISALVPAPRSDLTEIWESILFNSFHDILPGTSIERAFEEQIAWVGVASHQAEKIRFQALNVLARRIDTTVPPPKFLDDPRDVPILLWNPLPRPFKGQVEVEVSLDYRPIAAYDNRAHELPFAVRTADGKVLPFQEIDTEHSSMPHLAWRKRAVVSLQIPPLGWKVVRMGLARQKPLPGKRKDACKARAGKTISNSTWRISAGRDVIIKHKGKDFFLPRKNLSLMVVEDPWGSWGGMNEEPDSFQLDHIREHWKMTESHVLEKGPERASLWTRWSGKRSWVELTFFIGREIPWVAIHGRLLWSERSARLQLVLPSAGPALCDVPGGTVTRMERGQVPIGRWFYRTAGGRGIGVASDVLSDADFLPKETRLTLARASRYANDVPTGPREKPWQPAVDCGELKFRLHLFADGLPPDSAADALIFPPLALTVPPSAGDLAAEGSLGRLEPASIRLLSVQRAAGNHFRVRVQNRANKPVEGAFRLLGKSHPLGEIGAQEILTRSLPAGD